MKFLRVVLFFLLLIIKSGFAVMAQEDLSIKDVIDKSSKALNEINNLTYNIDYYTKFFSSDDTVLFQADVEIMRNPKNKFSKNVLFKLYGSRIEDNRLISNFERQFDGKTLYSSHKKLLDNEVIENFYSVKEHGYKIIQGNITHNLVLSNYFSKRNLKFFNSMVSSLLIQEKTIKKVLFKEEKCFEIYFKLKDRRDMKDGYIKLYIRDKDYLPIAFMESSTFQNMTEYVFYEINYLSINDENINIEDYDISVNSSDLTSLESYKNANELIVREGMKMPPLKFLSYDNKEIDISDYLGKIVIIDFWYRGCLPCLKAIPDLIDINAKYEDSLLKVVGINYNDKQEQVMDFASYRGINYASSYNSTNIIEEFGINAFPTTVIIDQSGKVYKIITGWNKRYKREIENLIKEIGTSQTTN